MLLFADVDSRYAVTYRFVDDDSLSSSLFRLHCFRYFEIFRLRYTFADVIAPCRVLLIISLLRYYFRCIDFLMSYADLTILR